MKGHWTDVAVAAALVIAGCAAIYVGLTRAVRRAVAEQQSETERQLRALEMTVKALQKRVVELGALQSPRVPQRDSEMITAEAENMAGEERNQLKPETLAVITAAATTAVGKKARIRSVQPVPADNTAGLWAQQGRVIVQTSHNLRPGS